MKLNWEHIARVSFSRRSALLIEKLYQTLRKAGKSDRVAKSIIRQTLVTVRWD